MSPLPVPVRTARADPTSAQEAGALHRLDWTLLGTIDGLRNVVQIESVAKAIGLDAAALARLEASGLIAYRRAPVAVGSPPRLRCEYDD